MGMTAVSQLIGTTLALAAATPVLILALECLVGAKPRPRTDVGGPLPFAVLIPAHDEELLVGETVEAVLAQLRPCDAVLVVADHCTDRTAECARSAGARVAVREGSSERGKGHALAFGRRVLCRDPRAVVIVVDADCRPEPGALRRLAATAVSTGAAVQGAYLLVPPADAGPMVRISSFAFLIKNLVRQRALERLTRTALLQGSGMAFPWPVFEALPLASASLVEDFELGLNMLLAGRSVRFEEAARITSRASTQASTAGQRRRWEHGMIAAQARYLPKLAGAVASGRIRLLGVLADLMVPPVTLLAVLAAAALAASVALLGPTVPTAVLTAALLLLGVALARVWACEGRIILPAAMFAKMPAYLFWKLPILAQFVTARERRWIRTGRQS